MVATVVARGPGRGTGQVLVAAVGVGAGGGELLVLSLGNRRIAGVTAIETSVAAVTVRWWSR